MRPLLLAALTLGSALAQVKEFKPSWLNLFSPAQDVQLGKESAAEVRKTMPVVNNADLTNYVNRIGQRLAKSKRAGNYPYTFEVINDRSINAFALPGGPMFVHTGLIAAVDNESQLAGVLAHEISHVYLRHGTNNVSKANLIQLPAMLAGSALEKQGGIWGALGQLGIGLGAQSMLLKYSRDAEKDADLNGAQIMHDAGYNPTEMAVFFDKLQAQGERDNSRLANFMSDHPTPGRRVDYVNEQNKRLPKRTFSEPDAGSLPRMKQIVAGLPAPPKPVQQGIAQPGGNSGADPRPSGSYRAHRGPNFQLNYPDNWEVFGDTQANSVTIAPRSTLVQDQQGNVAVGYGMIVSHYYPEGNGRPNLQRDTDALLRQMTKDNPSMRQSGKAKSVRVAGKAGLLTPFESASPYRGEKEVDMILTVANQDALFYTIFIAPDSEWQRAQPAFDHAVSSLRFD
jgi:Zn-dependent protease with chaperone function